ncbi:MAG TPA: AAA family ATPase, partial [Miltoncostaea sp.]|nr:AAA family ATPase [Miltoncostaea sp.]
MGVAPHDPLLERERELAGAAAALDAARAGHGGLVLVEGAAGIGKTALLRAVRARAADDGMLVLHARGAEMERDFAFGVVRQLVEPPLAAAAGPERAALLEGAAGVAAGLLALPGAQPSPGGGEPDPSFAVLHGLYWLLANLAAVRPVCLVVDDAHWADGPSLRFLTFLVPRLEELPVAAFVAFRPDEAEAREDLGRAIAADPGAPSLRPAPLTADGLAAMLADGLGGEPDPELAAACHRATGGSPFLAEALIGDLRDGDGRPAAEAVAAMEPRAVGRWVGARLARLTPSARRLAAAVAVLEEAGPALAADLAELSADEAADAADALTAAGLLAGGRPLAFAHPLVRTAVHADLPAGERAQRHRRAAELLSAAGADPARVAEHLLATDPGGRPWAVDRLVEAAEGAARSGAPESAAAYLRRAVAEPPPPDRLPGVLLRCGLAEANAGDPRWRDHLGAALETASAGPARVAAAMVLAHGLWRSTEIPAAVAVLDEAAAGVDGTDAAARDLLEAAAIGMGVADARTAGAMAGRVTRLRERVARADAPREALG